jgi:hypothetical protein
MAEAASLAPAEHSSMELMDSAVDGTVSDAAAAAAAAVQPWTEVASTFHLKFQNESNRADFWHQ